MKQHTQKTILPILAAFCLSICYWVYLINYSSISLVKNICILIYLFILFFLICKFVFPRLITRISRLSRKASRFLFFSALPIALWIIVFFPIRIPSFSLQNTSIEITATGQKNPKALASEVWVTGMHSETGQNISMDQFQYIGNWEIRDNIPVSFTNQPSAIKWHGNLPGDIHITFVSHPWSGFVHVAVNETEENIDLYSETPTTKEVMIAGKYNESLSSITYWAIFMCTLGCLGFLYIVVVNLLLSLFHVETSGNENPRKASWIGYAIPMVFVWSLYLLAFWPGIMSEDSINQWGQILSGSYLDNYVAFHTLTIWLLTRITLSPAVVAITQVAVLSCLAGFFISCFVRYGMNRWLGWVLAWVFALSPVNSTLSITLWKDVPYSIAVFGLTLVIFFIVRSDGEWLSIPRNWIALSIISSLVVLYRHNGLPVGFGTLLALLAFFPRKYKQIILSVLLSLFIVFSIRGPIYDWIGVKKINSSMTSALPIFQIAAHLSQNTPLSTSESEFLNSIRPIDDDWSYNCYLINPIMFGNFNASPIDENPGMLEKIDLDLSLRNPKAIINHYLCNSSLIWRVLDSAIYTVPVDGYVYVGSPYGLVSSPVLPFLHQILRPFIEISSSDSRLFWWVWRPALYLYLFLLGIIVAMIRNNDWRVLAIAVPIVFQSITISLLVAAQDFRYQYPVYLAALLFFPALVQWKKQVHSDETD